MIRFSLIRPEDWREAYQWHRGFVASNDLVFPRTIESYEKLAEDGQIWTARDDKGDFLALTYYQLGESSHHKCPAWEVGGVMVATSQRRRGIGRTIVSLTLGHVLTIEDPLARNVPVVAHVHGKNNPGPRPIFQGHLKFAHGCPVKIPEAMLPGLRSDGDGFIHGDEFVLTNGTLIALGGWCRGWAGKMDDGHNADIDFGPLGSLDMWAEALDNMASRTNRT